MKLFDRLILHQLDKVDPSKLKNDEKLAFWINVYNAIIMHVNFLSETYEYYLFDVSSR